MERKKVMLISPPFTQPKEAARRCVVPLGLLYLGAVLKAEGHEVRVLDCVVEGYDTVIEYPDGMIKYGLRFNEINKRIREFKPDFVGVSCNMSMQLGNALSVCGTAKLAGALEGLRIQTIMGGCHPSALPEETLKCPNVDTVVVGEAENVITDVITGGKKGIVRGTTVDVDKLPLPAWDLLPIKKYLKINMPTNTFSPGKRVMQIETSRSCPYRCVFCATTKFRGPYRARKVHDVIEEMETLIFRYKIDEFDIIDSNFTADTRRLTPLLREMKELNIKWANPGGMAVRGLNPYVLDVMKASGCYQISLAIESSTPRILKDVIHKPLNIWEVKPVVEHCKKIGIDLHAFFIIGWPEQTLEEMFNDYDFALEMGFTSASFNIVNPLPGSDLYEQYKDRIDMSRIDLRKANIPHREILPGDLEDLACDFNRDFNRSLWKRGPIRFVRKYVFTALRKRRLNLFGRQ